MLNNKSFKSHREFFSLIYRLESKRIIAKQIQIALILGKILERCSCSIPLNIASRLVEEYETKDEMLLNRIIMSRYLRALNESFEKK